MKRCTQSIAALVAVLFFAVMPVTAQPMPAVDTAFTYQGVLDDLGVAGNGVYDFTFNLFDRPVGGVALAPSVSQTLDVTDGLFTATIDFGAGALAGTSRYLEMEVGPKGGATTVLSPRQRIRSAPTAVQSAAAALLDDGTVVLQRAASTGSQLLLSNEKPDSTFDDSSSFSQFWQSFTPATEARMHDIGLVVKENLAPSITGWSLHEGTGAGGSQLASGYMDLVLHTSGLTLLRFIPFEEPELEAGQAYSVVIDGANFSFLEIPILGPGVGPSSFGGSTATWFELYEAAPDEARTFIEADGTLNISSSRPEIILSKVENTLPAYFTTAITSGGTEVRWWLGGSFEDYDLTYRRGGQNTRLIHFDGVNNRTGISQLDPLVKLHITQSDLGLQSAALHPNETVLIENTDAGLALYSNGGGTFGSFISLGEVDGVGALVDKWSIARRTSGFNNELQFSHGSDPVYSSNTINFALRPDGSAFLRGALTQNSTASEKHDVETLTDAIDTLLQLRGVSYTWNHSDKPDIGFIAEEMAEVMPEIVGFDEAGKPIGIDYGRVTALIVEATKDQQRQLDDQARLIEVQQQTVDKLRSVIDSLADRLDAIEQSNND